MICTVCLHERDAHSSGGMCDGGGTECYCIHFPDSPVFVSNRWYELKDLAEQAVRLAYLVPGGIDLDSEAHVPDEQVSVSLRRDRQAARALVALNAALADVALVTE
jgi:hypothetical protein